MNCWEALYTQVFHQHEMLITEQEISEPNPLLRTRKHDTNPSA